MTLSSSTFIPAKKDKLHTEVCVARMKQMRLGEEMRLQLHSRASRCRVTPQGNNHFLEQVLDLFLIVSQQRLTILIGCYRLSGCNVQLLSKLSFFDTPSNQRRYRTLVPLPMSQLCAGAGHASNDDSVSLKPNLELYYIVWPHTHEPKAPYGSMGDNWAPPCPQEIACVASKELSNHALLPEHQRLHLFMMLRRYSTFTTHSLSTLHYAIYKSA
ncbi:hypothetical protein FPSE_01916 [Fusarium pseudograminearum CS3096]|uniref:Uncharacterized protein n=1 Tax=Fusarium pseudograminearum (strain CS3096) TaxID=1028729 RepID=K3VUH5_FUSPC|nr:hypothetical protein FPSE_01916 [Fusarium pseudograminearum CS3096]EKJ77823.1 hypothetical protein FPSE_01916 [Fusarium pseudograminearum CS3096]